MSGQSWTVCRPATKEICINGSAQCAEALCPNAIKCSFLGKGRGEPIKFGSGRGRWERNLVVGRSFQGQNKVHDESNKVSRKTQVLNRPVIKITAEAKTVKQGFRRSNKKITPFFHMENCFDENETVTVTNFASMRPHFAANTNSWELFIPKTCNSGRAASQEKRSKAPFSTFTYLRLIRQACFWCLDRHWTLLLGCRLVPSETYAEINRSIWNVCRDKSTQPHTAQRKKSFALYVTCIETSSAHIR